MGVFHYLNVKQGDCSIIQHPTGHVTVVDVCNAASANQEEVALAKAIVEAGVPGNFNQKDTPVNPVAYLKKFGISSVFRFIATHPDMDHLDGIQSFFDEFSPVNLWDTDNECEKDFSDGGGQYNEDDWDFYTSLRDGKPTTDPKRLTLFAGERGHYYNRDAEGQGGGDGLHILAPTPELLAQANECDDYNDASYVILYRSNGGRILLAGDSHDKTWEHILANHEDDVKDVELLIAPHHGRKSDRSYDFLDVVRPKLTFFGNANSEHLAYGAWNGRGLTFITNNQANCMVVNTSVNPMDVYVTNKVFAEKCNPDTTYSNAFQGYYLGHL